MPLARSLTPTTQETDARAFAQFLDQQPAVDRSRKIGTMGYGMGGPITMRIAAAVPDRVGAGASFHGGGLVTDDADSPHRLIPERKTRILIAIAENDDERDPESKKILRESFEKVGRPAKTEVDKRAMHGGCPPDSVVYNEAQAERAWARRLALLASTLGQETDSGLDASSGLPPRGLRPAPGGIPPDLRGRPGRSGLDPDGTKRRKGGEVAP